MYYEEKYMGRKLDRAKISIPQRGFDYYYFIEKDEESKKEAEMSQFIILPLHLKIKPQRK